jgi:hypothetical protein
MSATSARSHTPPRNTTRAPQNWQILTEPPTMSGGLSRPGLLHSANPKDRRPGPPGLGMTAASLHRAGRPLPAMHSRLETGWYTHIIFGPDSYTDDATYADLINPVPAKFNNFIEQASTIALGKSASLTIVGYDRKNDSLVLGSGGWQLSEENVEKIDHLSKSLRIKFRLLR